MSPSIVDRRYPVTSERPRQHVPPDSAGARALPRQGPKVLFVHGMRMNRDERTLGAEWYRALRSALLSTEWGRAHPEGIPSEAEVDVVYWADLFRRPRATEAPASRPVRPFGPAREPASRFPRVLGALRPSYYAALRGVVLAADRLGSHSAEGRPRDLLSACFDDRVAQTAAYMHDGPVYGASDTPPGGAFTQVQARFQRKIGRGTRLVIGHSLGSVIAYEALCRLRHGVRSFVTVGSPIATPRLILEPLRRRQRRMLGAADDARFAWPGVARWTNVFAAADVWCVPVLRLAPVFDPRIRDVAVTHGSTLAPSASHALPQYLHHREVAEELARSLAESATDAERGPASTAA